jgi:hypothetical protein
MHPVGAVARLPHHLAEKEIIEMLNRRHALKLTAALAASQAVPDAVSATPASGPVEGIFRELPHLSLTDDLEDVIDALAGHIQTFRAADWAEYKARLAEVVALDPEGLAYRSGSPVCELDEAAVGMAVSAWADGLRLGAALALERQATA